MLKAELEESLIASRRREKSLLKKIEDMGVSLSLREMERKDLKKSYLHAKSELYKAHVLIEEKEEQLRALSHRYDTSFSKVKLLKGIICESLRK